MQVHDLTTIVELVFWLIFLVASVAQLPQVRALIKGQVGEKRASQLEMIANVAVNMTEQQLGKLPGNEKKLAAVSAFKNLAQEQGVNVSEAEIHAFIEAAVLFLPKSIKLLPDQIGQVQTQPQVEEPTTQSQSQAPAVPAA